MQDLPPDADISLMEPHEIAASSPGGRAWAALGTRDFLRMSKHAGGPNVEWMLTDTPGDRTGNARQSASDSAHDAAKSLPQTTGTPSAQNGPLEAAAPGLPVQYARPDNRTIVMTSASDPQVRVKMVLDRPPADGGDPQRVEVPEIYRGNLAPGAGSALLAQALADHGVVPSQLVFRSVEHEGTLVALLQGRDPAATVLGKSGARTLGLLGLQPQAYRSETDSRGGLDLVIDVAQVPRDTPLAT
jgi:hypothetical protein